MPLFNLPPLIFPIVGLFIMLLIGFLIILFFSKKEGGAIDLSIYEKKPYLFDTNSEFVLYKILIELFGETHHVFPQINYGHLIQPRKSNWDEERRYRSRIDRKSADFVLCDKERVVPKLVIELDGGVHNLKSKKARDEFINEITKIADLPILHFKNSNLDKNFIKEEVNKKLMV